MFKMGFKNFLIGFIKNIIILLVATLIFSSITLDFPELIRGLFGDIFAYASPEVQKKVVSQLAETCSSLDQGQSLVTINQICVNKSLLESMKENCANYRELKTRNIKIENEQQIRETCFQIESEEIERYCNQLNEKISLLPDFSNIGALCKDYKAGRINDKDFFFNVMNSAIPSQMQMPNIGFLEKYNNSINYLNKNKIIYFVILAILLILLHLLIMDIKLFILTLTGISFSIGILIMLPYFAIMLYEKFVGFDTTSILNSIIGNLTGFEPKSILSVALLMFLRTYNSLIITLGIIFLIIGIGGKIYGFIFKRKISSKGKIKQAKIKKKK